MSLFAILLGGHLTTTPRLLDQLAGARFIAADGGIVHAGFLDVVPELWVGDFDSSSTLLDRRHAKVPRQQFSSDKDMTDGALAIAEALHRGATELLLVGGFGGRFDHVLGHGLQLVSLAERGVDCFMTSGHEEAYPMLRDLRLNDLAHGTRVSILGLTALGGLSIAGVRWPLDRVAVPFGSTRTLSNEVAGEVTVTLEHGRALVVVYPEEHAA